MLAPLYVLAGACISPIALAEDCEPVVGGLVSVEGKVEVRRASAERWEEADLQEVLCQGDSVRVGVHSRAAVALINDAVLRIDQRTTLQLVDIVEQQAEPSLIELIFGAFQTFFRQPRLLRVRTPYLNGSIEGTEFVLRVVDEQAVLTVLEGRVLAENEHGRISVGRNQSVAAEAGSAPQPRVVVRPREAAQWALYYPPLLAAPGGAERAGSGPLADALRANDTPAALAALENVPQAERDAGFFVLRAALLLSVGRVEDARADIDRALARDAGAGLAFALRAVVGVVQNDLEQALADGNRAVASSPDSAAAHIALSYAQQGAFQIPMARETLLRAVQLPSADALAWTRLAELELMLGFRERAVEAAEKAASLAPGLARTQSTLGFIRLAEFRTGDAQAAFERAVALDSADPLAHLGLGLARIGAGDLARGRAAIEIAVGLDASSALLRAYLGKAYFEEKRPPLDAEQFAMARDLDPFDPTAFLYDGIRNQTENRPVQAARDIDTSIRLNDNRAAYRGRLLLDQDRAARGTSLARVHKDLGFTQLGIDESTHSLALDPSNASAHRFLSDSYRGMSRFEIARVSELFQAQLLQDSNINPVQPSISESNLNIVALGGPASAAFNEFTPLFQRNGTQFNVTAVGGSEGTAGAEAVVSGVADDFSYSFGAFAYETDGWRANNDLEQDVYNVYLQGAIGARSYWQAELMHRRSLSGDLVFGFDPDDLVDDRRIDTSRSSARVGFRHSPDPSSDLLVSVIHSERDETRSETDQIDPTTLFAADTELETDGSLVEIQAIRKAENSNYILGAAYSESETTGSDVTVISDVVIGPLFEFDEPIDESIEHSRAYAYANIGQRRGLIWTLGASYDDLTDEPIERSGFNPKLGVRWLVDDEVQLRAAAFQVLKPSLINNRTIEPTQVAGFNQLFDDATGTEARTRGIGIDVGSATDVAWGAEATWRDLDVPVVLVTEDGKEEAGGIEQDEEHHRLYLYLAAGEQVALSAELAYDRFREPSASADAFRPVPAEVTTTSVPLGVSYFRPNGLFASLRVTYVEQRVERAADAVFAQGKDSFSLVDVAVGYRFAQRRGIASLGVKNLTDEEFEFLDDSFREFSEDATTGPYAPEQMVLGRITLSF